MIVFVTLEEEDLLPTLVEAGPGNDQRTADVAARVVVRTDRFRRSDHVVERVAGIEVRGARVEVRGAVETAAATLAEGVDHHRPLGVLGRKVRIQDRYFRNHVRIWIDRSRSTRGAGVEDVLSILGDIDRLAIDGDRAESARVPGNRAAVNANRLTHVTRPVDTSIGLHHRAGQNLDEFRGIPADQRQVFQLFGGDQGDLLARILHGHCRDLLRHLNRSGARRHFEGYVHRPAVTAV